MAGVTSGLLSAGDQVTWEARHLGVRQRLTAKITKCVPPDYFVNVMVSGAFKSFIHRHSFITNLEGTLMIDDFDYVSPLGILGHVADALFLKRYMTNFLRERAEFIKRVAES